MIASLKKLLVRGGLVYFCAGFLAPFLSILAVDYTFLEFPASLVIGLSVILYLDCIWFLEALTRHYWGWQLADPSDTWLQTIIWNVVGIVSGVVLALIIATRFFS